MFIRCAIGAAVVSGLMVLGGCGNGGDSGRTTDRRTSATTDRDRTATDQDRVRIVQTGARGDIQSAIGNPDEFFLVRAAQLNAAEIAAGRIAVERASNPEVRQYGQQMIEDHTRANQELMRLAERKGVSLPTQPDEMHRTVANHLEQLDGDQFDREYISAMVADHAMALSMMQDRARLTQDPEIRDFADRQVPIFHEHLQMAQDLNRSIGAGSTSAPAGSGSSMRGN